MNNSKEEILNQLTSDIQNTRIKQLIRSHKNLSKLLEHPRQSAKKHAEQVNNHQSYLKQYQQRKWLIKKGRKYLIDFDNQQRREMKQYFNSLDQKKTGSIGIDQLEELLFSVGLFETRQEIKALIDSVDQDKSGKIEFSEFLSMIQNDQGQNEEIVSFFKTLIGQKIRQNQKDKAYHRNNTTRNTLKRRKENNMKTQQSSSNLHQKSFNQTNAFLMQTKYTQNHRSKSHIPQILQKYPYPKGLPFEMVVSHIRRKHMMTALNIGRANRKMDNTQTMPSQFSSYNTENTVQQIAKGQRVMHALQKMYQRKLIRQIKQNKRVNELSSFETTKPNYDKVKINFNQRHTRIV